MKALQKFDLVRIFAERLKTGESWKAIANKYGLQPAMLEEAYTAFLQSAFNNEEKFILRAAQIAKLEQLQEALWSKCLEGDVGAIRAYIELTKEVVRLAGAEPPKAPTVTIHQKVKGYVQVSPDAWPEAEVVNESNG